MPKTDTEIARPDMPAEETLRMEVTLQARTPTIGKLVQDCADKKISFDELCRRATAMGFKTTSLFEMVRAAETASH